MLSATTKPEDIAANVLEASSTDRRTLLCEEEFANRLHHLRHHLVSFRFIYLSQKSNASPLRGFLMRRSKIISKRFAFDRLSPHSGHPCQDPTLNDCHPAGSCRATGAQSYTCECLQGYADKSPDPKKPGRICVLTEPVCLDRRYLCLIKNPSTRKLISFFLSVSETFANRRDLKFWKKMDLKCLDSTLSERFKFMHCSQNDCHSAAICSEVSGPEKYTCQCRDGYIDQSPNRNTRPGRICVEMVGFQQH